MRAEKTDRIPYIASARVIGILLVVLGHSYPFDVPIPRSLDQMRAFIYTFHMPLFILISGYLAAKSSRAAGEYIAVRAKKLLIPYLVLSVAAFIPKILVQQYLNDSLEFSFAYLLRSEFVPRENVWGHFWYIPVIFFFGVFSALLSKQMKERKWVQVVALAGSYMLLWLPETTDWFALEDMRKTFFYYVLGFLLSCKDEFECVVRSKLWLLGLPSALAVFFSETEPKTLVALLMIGFVFCFGTIADLRQNAVCKQIEQYSFTIFLLSWPAQAVMEVVLSRMLQLPVLVSMAGMFMAGIVVPLLCIQIVNWLEKYVPVRWLKLVLGM